MGDEARLRGCLLFLPINCCLLCRLDGTFVSQRCFGSSILVWYRTAAGSRTFTGSLGTPALRDIDIVGQSVSVGVYCLLQVALMLSMPR
jgi:hypothetical protein